MAVFDRSQKPFIIDKNENMFIGLTLPLAKSTGIDGWFLSTTTIKESIKVNLKNLLKTNKFERLYHPNLGLNLRRFMFEPITESIKISIQEEVRNTIRRWIPFVLLDSVQIFTNVVDDDTGRNQIHIEVQFRVNKNEASDSIGVEVF